MTTRFSPLLVLAFAALTAASGAAGQAATLPVAQSPLFVAAQVPPLNMLVVGRDHKIYYEAYNDASDLNGDGRLDVGYRPHEIDYFGYFNSFACYLWDAGQNRFEPVAAAPNKTCSGSGQWSGDFLNYLTTSRKDALRRVLYGGWRHEDTATDTTLQGAFFPQDAHSWGREYESIARDGFDIRQFAPLPLPSPGTRHLFAVTTVTGNERLFPNYQAPMLRVMQHSPFRVWQWLSIEGPVAGNRCFNAANQRVDCLAVAAAPSFDLIPASRLSNVTITTWRWDSPGGLDTDRDDASELDEFFSDFATPDRRCGSQNLGSVAINATGSNNNPFSGSNACTHDRYLTEITATLTIDQAGTYRFAIDGDDTTELSVNGAVLRGRYGDQGSHGRTQASWDANATSLTLAAGTHTLRFRHVENTGGDNWGLAWQQPGAAAATRQDFFVRVQACPADANLQDASCRRYPSGVYKPTGILHDYGESGRMMFGLITGSQRNNLEGGVLRRNVVDFRSEINADTGQFRTDVNGIVRNLDRLRMIGGAYNGGVTNNLTSDANWNWSGGTGGCPSIGHRAINNRECRMWGNPVGEMLYESMRYFAGAAAPTPRFADAPEGSAGVNEEATMGLTMEAWRDPFAPAPAGLGHLSCARPHQTIISDINPSYDGDLPGSPFAGAITSTGVTPPTLAGFHAANEGQAIWNHQFGAGSREVFIGQIGNAVSDGAPTAKAASSLGNIRGLAPEEPTKMGTFFSASVARFGRVNDVHPAPGNQRISTFAVALASPLPRIEFPVGGRVITLVPFAKTISGTFGGDPVRKPVNTIVDFYVENIVNLPGQPINASVNGGRPYAAFRINYEDVEQGNDHDMDAIVRYEVLANADGTVTVRLNSEYAAGSANQAMGYVISGTTADGVYLEVRDTDGPSSGVASLFRLNTPPGATAGQCTLAGALSTAPCNQALPLMAVRVFTPAPAGAAATAINLPDPLWFAAKFGGFREPEAGGNGLPEGTEWDANADGVPDNYFLVTNPLRLRQQLSAAFDQILGEERPAGGLANTGSRLNAGSQEFVPEYRVDASERDWTGDVKSYHINADGSRGSLLWSARDRLAASAPGTRRIFTTALPGDAGARQVVPFNALAFGSTRADQVAALGLTVGQVDTRFGATITGANLFDYLRGERAMEQAQPGGVFRDRSALIGSIIHSEPRLTQRTDVFRWINVPELRTDYQTFVEAKRADTSRPNTLFVGSNNGKLHAFNAATGDEVFAFVPASARLQMGLLPDPTFTHRFLMDGDVNVVDARIGGQWGTVLVGSAGRGGSSVFALDVTRPQSFNASSVLWEHVGGSGPGQDRDLGLVLGRPQIMYGEDQNFYAVFGNGINSFNGNPVLMVVNLSTGVVTSRIVANDGGNFGNGLNNIAMVDADGNGRIDAIYGGDMRGNLWKFDMSSTSPTAWNVAFAGSPLFRATDASGNPQPITGGIDVARGGGGLMVYFGTGRYIAPEDAEAGTNPQVQSIYGVLDRGVGGITRSQLAVQTVNAEVAGTRVSRTTSANAVSFLTQRGWVLDLAVSGVARGERFLGDPDVRGGVVFFPTFEITGDRCQPGGRNWMYGLDAITGGSALGGTRSISGGTVGSIDTGAVEAGSGAPIRAAVFTQIPPPCRPGIDPNCPIPTPGAGGTPAPVQPGAGAQTRCGEVERRTGAVFERACGRQSWRQIR